MVFKLGTKEEMNQKENKKKIRRKYSALNQMALNRIKLKGCYKPQDLLKRQEIKIRQYFES